MTVRAMARGCGRSSLLLAALAAFASVGCSDLDAGDESYCDVNAGVGPCGTVGIDEDIWWCLDEQPPPLPMIRPNQLVGFALPAFDWSTRIPMSSIGITATLCPPLDSTCPRPLAPPYLVVDGRLGSNPLPLGAAGVPVPEGFDGFIKFNAIADATAAEADRYVPANYYLGGTVSGDMTTGGPILMLQRGLGERVVRQSFPTADPLTTLNQAALAFGVYDCNGNAARDVRVEVNVGGTRPPGVLPFQLPASRIPIAQPLDQDLVTDVTGLAGYLNVPPGAVQLIAYQRTGMQREVGRVELGAVPGELSIGSIRPAYVLDANIKGAPPVEPAGG